MQNVWTKRCRNERFMRYWQAMADRNLRRQRLILYISRKIDTSPKATSTAEALAAFYEMTLEQMQAEFAQVHEMLASIFSGQGARIIPMTDADHYRHYKMFLNPSLADRFDYDIFDAFDPEFPSRRTAGTAKATARPISVSAWTAITTPSSPSRAGRK